MFTESRKIHLIEELLKVDDDTLSQLESIIKKAKRSPKKKQSAHDFVGLWSKKDAALIENAIKEGCEQVHADDWK